MVWSALRSQISGSIKCYVFEFVGVVLGTVFNWPVVGLSSSHRLQGEIPMPELSHINPRSAALLVMDYQVDALTRFMTAAQSADAIACVPDLIAMARDARMMVIHVVVAFRDGHPEVSPLTPCSAS